VSLTCSGTRDVADPVATGRAAARVACVEVGASGCQSTIVDGDTFRRVDGVDVPPGRPLLLAVPGLIEGPRVLAASNLGWYDVDPVAKLGLPGMAALLLGDAEAAALGEYALRGAETDLLYVGLGTGVGGAVVRNGEVADNLLGHLSGFGARPCRCGQVGCLETVAGGWALPRPLSDGDVRRVAVAIADAVRAEPLAQVGLVVVAGGIAAHHPEIVSLVADELADRTVQPTAAPADAKSASAWGLLHAFRRAS
jgi:predicted NBD/HSP70 family sugar kinase